MRRIALPLLIAGLAAVVASAYAQRESAPALVITRNKTVQVLTINSSDGRRLVAVNLETGKVTLTGEPDEAARQFWDAVSRAGMARCKP